MRLLVASRTLVIPDGVTIEVKARSVRVKGPRGECQGRWKLRRRRRGRLLSARNFDARDGGAARGAAGPPRRPTHRLGRLERGRSLLRDPGAPLSPAAPIDITGGGGRAALRAPLLSSRPATTRALTTALPLPTRSAGTLQRDFKHLAVDMYLTEVDGAKALLVDCHFGRRKALASIRTCTSHVQNMITGVTRGFEYKMRLVYAHFPININIEKKGAVVEIRNFLGEKRVRIVRMLAGVTVERSSAVKDELVISGNDVELVSRSAALINMICHVRKKDIRKFLDGVYLAERTTIVKDED